MVNVQDLMEHISEELGVGSTASYPFKVGYMVGILEEMQLRYPEVRNYLESHAREYNFAGVE